MVSSNNRIAGDTLRIPDVIEVTVLEVRNDQVRVGITTPKDTPFYREETYPRVVDKQSTPH
ncbi:MAG: carbon storage regulator [Gammaproteobacteria bacterium]|nr:carbon storage regulator [Gammaproteobacteria bacterium]